MVNCIRIFSVRGSFKGIETLCNFFLQLLQNCDLPCVTFGVEKVPIGENSFVGVPHNYHSSSLERANVLLRKVSSQNMNTYVF